DTRLAGAAGEQTGASRPWRFGDVEPWDVGASITNAVLREAGERGASGPAPGGTSNSASDTASGTVSGSPGVRLTVDDIEVRETEARTRAAVVLLVDVSFSMAAEGRWLPMKRTALALHRLVSTRFRGDDLELIAFGRHAQR